MLLSVKWLRELTPYAGTLDDLSHRLTMLGLEVEEIIEPFAGLKSMVVGHVVECEPHPESDHLSVCKVDVGTEVLDIVCGAPNVAAGQNVPVAPVGSVMPGGMQIKKAKLRGMPSRGMICSEAELELGSGQAGIMVLDESLTPGTSLIEALGLETTVLDIGITPNRADCLSVLGIARETAAAYNLPLNLPETNLVEGSGTSAGDEVKIVIDDPALCPVYKGRIIRGVTIGPSPAWLQRRLLAIGQRPINNVVDITNYILFETGQPLHSFDLDLLKGNMIGVGLAEEGQKFTTLDDQERTLKGADLLIRDGERPVALAGVMGGANSEIHDGSTNVFLEAAVFNPATIRKTARRLGLSSEASFRFERGVDQLNVDYVLDRATALIAELGGGEVAPGVAVAEPAPFTRKTIRFRPQKARDLLAVELSDEFCASTLKGLGCIIEGEGEQWSVTAPSFRLDLEREVDLIEEVGRVYGLDRIPEELPRILKTLDGLDKVDPTFDFIGRVKNWGRGVGLNEAVNYSFVGSDDLDGLDIDREGQVFICNPLSEDQNVLRPEIGPGLLNNLKLNLGQNNTRVKLFEVAHVFRQDSESDTQTRESNRLGVLLSGPRHPERFPFDEEIMDYTDLKGLVEQFLSTFRIHDVQLSLDTEHPWLEPCVRITSGDELLGRMGMVAPDRADRYNARDRIWMADLDLDLIQGRYLNTPIVFNPLPKFPVAKRDMTLVAPRTMPVKDIPDAVGSMKQPLLEEIRLVDVYLPEGGEEKNLTFRMTYRHAARTLKDKEVDKAHNRLGEELVKILGVRFQ
ncbi:MAG TPA: phenylalanine--tRNA ligase subunit beta [Desulfomicrobiaceae bacterium]|nr:phenylalanine--tRNA ligase subunit beta [Desulfomicrobiaceae bacterium]